MSFLKRPKGGVRSPGGGAGECELSHMGDGTESWPLQDCSVQEVALTISLAPRKSS